MRFLLALVLLGLAGCGGSGNDGAGGQGGGAGAAGSSGKGEVPEVPGTGGCTDFTPCGGDLDGHWLLRDACIERAPEDVAAIVSSCPTSSNAGMTLEPSGSYDFDLDLLTVDLSVTTTLHVAFNSDCARSLHTDLGSLCSEYGAAQAADPQFSSTSCDVSGSECRCTLVGVPATRNVFMNYEIVGNEFTDSTGGTTEFCVEGGRLSTRGTQGGDVLVIGLEHE
jgi:hypothetical protein